MGSGFDRPELMQIGLKLLQLMLGLVDLAYPTTVSDDVQLEPDGASTGNPARDLRAVLERIESSRDPYSSRTNDAVSSVPSLSHDGFVTMVLR